MKIIEVPMSPGTLARTDDPYDVFVFVPPQIEKPTTMNDPVTAPFVLPAVPMPIAKEDDDLPRHAFCMNDEGVFINGMKVFARNLAFSMAGPGMGTCAVEIEVCDPALERTDVEIASAPVFLLTCVAGVEDGAKVFRKFRVVEVIE